MGRPNQWPLLQNLCRWPMGGHGRIEGPAISTTFPVRLAGRPVRFASAHRPLSPPMDSSRESLPIISQKEMRLFGRYLPNFSYQLFDLNQTNIDSIIFSLTLRAILYTFKNIWNLEDIRKPDELFLLSRDLLDENSGPELIRKLLLYISGAKDIQPEVLFDRVERIAPEKGVEKGIRQGMQKGKTEGLRQGIKEKAYDAARRMLSKGYPMEDIAEITGLSEEDIQRL